MQRCQRHYLHLQPWAPASRSARPAAARRIVTVIFAIFVYVVAENMIGNRSCHLVPSDVRLIRRTCLQGRRIKTDDPTCHTERTQGAKNT